MTLFPRGRFSGQSSRAYVDQSTMPDPEVLQLYAHVTTIIETLTLHLEAIRNVGETIAVVHGRYEELEERILSLQDEVNSLKARIR